MHYSSPKKLLLFWLAVISIVLFLWLSWLGIDSYLLTRNPLATVEESRVFTMAILAIVLLFILLTGLVLATLLGNKRYSRYFSIFSAILLVSLLVIRSLPR